MTDYYDIFPLAFLVNEEQQLTITPYGYRKDNFPIGSEYEVSILEVEKAEDHRFSGGGCESKEIAKVNRDGQIVFNHVFKREGMYLVNISGVPELRVYALNDDMKGRYPWRGDLHMHTNRSDGTEPPKIVCANYRGHGYDFTVISDHHRYYPSLEAREFYHIDKNDNSDITDMLIVPGEEVHLPYNDVHYVNFGGKFSINALVTPNCNQEANGDDVNLRSFSGNCPGPISLEDFTEKIKKRAKDVPLEFESERMSYAVAEWIYEKQKLAGGLGIFPHPYWLCRTMQLSQEYTNFFYEHPQFDAFEVLGGESYYQHNGFQTAFYYEMKAKGITYPVVGSTDSHCSFKSNRNSLICSTIVFAKENKVDDLVSSIKDYYSVAVDTISPEYRLVGDFRFVKYGSFLMENWYPIHDKICKAEGVYMTKYAHGEENSEKILKAIKGEIPSMMKKYFNI